jgi:hypothetical protein
MQPKKVDMKIMGEVSPDEMKRLTEALGKIEGFEFIVGSQVRVSQAASA